MLEIATTFGRPAVISDTEFQALRTTMHGQLLRAADPEYDAARVIFNGMFDRRPALILRCRGAADVMDAVQFARKRHLVTAVRGGGHNVAGNATCDDGVVIDLSGMKGVLVDRQRRVARVQGGATWADVDRETQAFGMATPGGIVSHTGVAGLTLNGGIGWLRNKYGLSCDNVLSAEVVTADGHLLSASATENEELFWALRGGGGNFGVVTSFEFQLHAVGPLVAAVFSFYPMAMARDVLKQWNSWLATAPDDVSSEIVLWTAPDVAALPPAVRGRAVAIAGAVYAGAAEEGMRVLRPLREFGEPLAEIADVMSYRTLQTAFDSFFPNTGELISHWKSLYLDNLDNDAVEIMVDRAEHRSSPATMVFVQHLGGGIRRVRPDQTAFPVRDAGCIMNFAGTWRDARQNGQHVAWVRDAWERLARSSGRTVYLNYLGQEERDATALVRSAFGANYDRLVGVKTKYDPTNFFRLNQNIPPATA
jgi:FAD/FMN-containing dehydrogenase